MDAEVAEHLRDLITRLQTDEDIPSAMNQLKTLLVSAPTEISETILEVGLSKILQCFNIFDRYVNFSWDSISFINCYYAIILINREG